MRAAWRADRGHPSPTITALLVLVVLAVATPAAAAAAPAEERWIVQLRPGSNVQRFLEPTQRLLGVRPTHLYRHVFRGFAASLSAAQRRALLRDPRVAAIELDRTTTVVDSQTVPPGIGRVGANPSAIRAIDGSDPALAVDIAVLDTGIDAGHPDLRVVGGRNCTSTASGWDRDPHGHGTHVGGIAAARDNAHGVVGVAPGARLWSVKVLNQYGNGYASWLICGLDWVAGLSDPADPGRPRIEVVNMSLRTAGSDDGNCGFSNADLLHQAVCRLERAGVTAVAAAGNDGGNATNWVPAAYDEVITVSALADYDGRAGGLGSPPSGCGRQDADDAFAGFSNYGADVDLIAPGVCVLSTARGGGYERMSGTSMATPHVAGGAALYHLYEVAQGRPRPIPQQVRAALIRTGSAGWRTASDPDGRPEPLLDVSSLELAPSFAIGATPSSWQRGPGEAALADVWLARLAGFSGSVSFDVTGLPTGASWRFRGEPFGESESGWRRLEIELPLSGAAGTYPVTISASSAGTTRSLQIRLHFQGGVVGAAGAPRVILRGNLTTKPVALPVLVKWNAVGDAQRYRLQVSRDGGAWSDVSLASATSLSVRTTAWPGSTYLYRLRIKRNGSWGSWLLGKPTFVTPHYAGEGIALSSGWVGYTHYRTYSEIPAYSKQAGARARLDFVGQGVSWIATRGPRRGRARVYIDGTLVARVDLYASTVQHRRVVFRRSWVRQGSHRIVIEVVGTRGRPRVDVDALVVLSTN